MTCLTRFYCDFYFIVIWNAMLLLPIVLYVLLLKLCCVETFTSASGLRLYPELNQNGLWYKSNMIWYDIILYMIIPRTGHEHFVHTWTRAKIWPGLYFLLLCVSLFMVFEDKCVTQPVRVDICVVCLPKYAVELDWMQTFSPHFIFSYLI